MRETKELNFPSNAESIFEDELVAAEEAELFLEREDVTKEELIASYRAFVKKYKQLVRHGIKITRLGDAGQKKLLRIQKELEQTVEKLKISEQKALEASHAKTLFLANMSHELRTPLNAIIGFAQLLGRDRKLTTEQAESVRVILRSGEHLLALINDVLSLSKIEAGKMTLEEQQFNLYRMLRSIEEMFLLKAQSKDLKFDFHIPEDVPKFVCGDERKLRQILINLIGNAFKFTSQGYVRVSICYREDRFYFAVEDTGQGIAAEEINKVFEAFVQTESGRNSKEGTGLGLAISRDFVRLMGGDITVCSEVGKGTKFEFSVRLKVVDESSIRAVHRTRVKGLAAGQREYKLLVTDDNVDNRKLLSRLFTSCGFAVREATNGYEAVELWRQWSPDLIWMDLRMPEMDGYETAAFIRRLERENGITSTKIIAMTASAFQLDEERMLNSDFDGFVMKPFREEMLFDLLAKHLQCEFICEDMEGLTDSQDTSAVFGRETLQQIPKSYLDSLREALLLGDTEQAHEVITLIKKYDEQIAEQMSKLVRRYQFERLFKFLDRVGLNAVTASSD
ncbi:MAG: ATP-binding protein [Acidobacteriota bacterium]|nr:ATP-binding protein [Blastocatellia bacterium]MDW8412994.1 ATP-binding protein [Acidobacteriota bacterium]